MNVGASRLEDRLDPLEPPYRSRGEAQVGRLLDRYGIPFFYEQATIVLDRGLHRCWHPDFTLPGLDGLIVEYAGMPDVPAYMAGIRHKQEAYKANGMPAVFVYPRDLQGPKWPETLVRRIATYPEKASCIGPEHPEMDGERRTQIPVNDRYRLGNL